MRFNGITNRNQLTGQTHVVRLPSADARKLGAASAASIFTECNERCGKRTEIKYERQYIAVNLGREVCSGSAEIDQTNFEIQRFKNQMNYFIVRLRPVYLARAIKEA
jgi:hypothetical protein